MTSKISCKIQLPLQNKREGTVGFFKHYNVPLVLPGRTSDDLQLKKETFFFLFFFLTLVFRIPLPQSLSGTLYLAAVSLRSQTPQTLLPSDW